MPVRRFLKWVSRAFGKRKSLRLAIYGPPNSGKTTLANRIISDFVGGAGWHVSDCPHQTRKIQQMEEVVLESASGKTLRIDLFDMPGISTHSELHTDTLDAFLAQGMSEEDAKKALEEAADGIVSSIRMMKEIDAALLVLDSTKSPYSKVNALLLGILKSNGVKLLVVANKIDLTKSNPSRVKEAISHLPCVGVSAEKGTNIEQLYEAMTSRL